MIGLHISFQDLNIGIALWLAAGGDGWVSDANTYDNDGNHVRIKYKSNAKILLVGSGADEQCAGYGRHRTSYRRGRYYYDNGKLCLSIILILMFTTYNDYIKLILCCNE